MPNLEGFVLIRSTSTHGFYKAYTLSHSPTGEGRMGFRGAVNKRNVKCHNVLRVSASQWSIWIGNVQA